MGISDFSKRDYLYLAPKSYKCPFCRREHTYDKEYFDYQSGKTKNRSLVSYQTLYPGSLVLKCNSLIIKYHFLLILFIAIGKYMVALTKTIIMMKLMVKVKFLWKKWKTVRMVQSHSNLLSAVLKTYI